MKRTVTIEVAPTPEELGEAFAGMSSPDQARFFGAVAATAKRDFPDKTQQQWAWLAAELAKSTAALGVVVDIAHHIAVHEEDPEHGS